MPINALGQIIEGPERLGDGSGTPPNLAGNGLAVSYIVQPLGVNGLAITYSVIASGNNGLLVSYTVVPPITKFSINGNTSIPAPQRIDYNPPAPIGYDLSGIEPKQGYTSICWNYDVILDSDIGALMALYNPNSPGVVIVFPDETGQWRQASAYMLPPVLGTRATVVHSGVQLCFTHITPS